MSLRPEWLVLGLGALAFAVEAMRPQEMLPPVGEGAGRIALPSAELLRSSPLATADDDFGAIRDAFLNHTAVEFAVMDGDIATAGSQGLRASCMVTNFSRNEALEEAITVSVTVKPTFSANPPTWMTIA